MQKCRALTIKKVRKSDGQKVRFKPSVKLDVTYCGGMLCADGRDLPLSITATNREQLKANTNEELRFLIEEYAEGDELMMNDRARALRRKLRERII